MAGLSEDYMKSVSESQLKDRAYTPFEIQRYERDSIEEIKKCIKKSLYKEDEAIKESLEFVQQLADLKKVYDQLVILLQDFENKESEKKKRK